MSERDPKCLSKVFAFKSESAFELNLDVVLAVDVNRDQVRALPIVRQSKSRKPVVGENSSELCEIEVLLLAGVQRSIVDTCKLRERIIGQLARLLYVQRQLVYILTIVGLGTGVRV